MFTQFGQTTNVCGATPRWWTFHWLKRFTTKTLNLHNLRLPLMILPPTMLNLDYGQVLQVPLPLNFSHCNSELPSMLHFTKLPSATASVFFKRQNPFVVTRCVTDKTWTLCRQSVFPLYNIKLKKYSDLILNTNTVI